MRLVGVSGRPSRRLLEACAGFGVGLVRARTGPECAAGARLVARDVARRLEPGRVAVVEGPSGSGKSVLLAALARRLGARAMRADDLPPADPALALVDLVGDSTARALAVLARAGLADATILARRAGELSDGQRWRLDLARLLERAEAGPGAWLLIDEFAGLLDDATAMGVSLTLSRWARAVGVRVVVATVRPGPARWLAPQLVVRAGLGGALDGVHDRPGTGPRPPGPSDRAGRR
ncbi:MAG: hypothetical protein FJ255_08855 [Phycisphaerae bacterium]|nr:hypothetical protein [Phycisphaerae bacterium]